MKTIVYSFVTPGYDKRIDDGRVYLEMPREVISRCGRAKMAARMAKALPHKFLDIRNADACLWLDSNISFKDGYSAEQLIEEYFSDTQYCGVFEHTSRTKISEEVEEVKGLRLEDPELADMHKSCTGRLAWTGILFRTFDGLMLEANNRWWAELSTKSYRDQLSFPLCVPGFD